MPDEKTGRLDEEFVVQMKGITKVYPNGVAANQGVDFNLRKTALTNGDRRRILMPSSSGNCYEQDTTSPQHRFQKAVGCARRQQGAGDVIPCEQLRQKRIFLNRE